MGARALNLSIMQTFPSPRHAIVVTALLLAACSTGMEGKPTAEVKDADPNAAAEPSEAADADADTPVSKLVVDTQASKIGFRGAKVTGHHDGGFTAFTGTAEVAGDEPRAVTFEVDMGTTWPDNEKLTGHLKSPDFFDVEKFDKSTFKSTKITPKADGEYTHVIEGTLNLHGETKVISFPAKIQVAKDDVRGSSEFKINRKDFGIVYPGMPDDLIKDEVLLKLDLVFPRA